ncbi:MAG: aminodeoxychorismate/anthranilate synthase component II [Elusimicrobia bacterium]|nr:aminodeoxychorismate/anthranilate synthase component II [Elusimicrobiota bacterium]
MKRKRAEKSKRLRIAVIDNYDSFVYNLCDYFGRLKRADLEVFRNDAVSAEEVIERAFDAVVISPGPGNPSDAGISVELIKKAGPDLPVLGVCLGHQCLGAAFGGKIIRADRILHGKTSLIKHNGKDIFRGLENPFEATRYHSLIIEKKSLPSCLKITARTAEGEIMGVRHARFPYFGVQFHPESILTSEGLKLIRNFTDLIQVSR